MDRYFATFLLLIASLIWGSAFVAQSTGMDNMGPFTFTAIRLLLGGLSILPFAILLRKKKHLQFR